MGAACGLIRALSSGTGGVDMSGEYGGGAGLAGFLRAISAGVSGVVTASFEGMGGGVDKDISATEGVGAGAKLELFDSDRMTQAMKRPMTIL